MSNTPILSRRDWLTLSAAGVLAPCLSGWFEGLAEAAAAHPLRKKACILLWMEGGPSQMDTFDLKPGHANGGPFKEIATKVPGIKISEHLPKIARHMDRMALVRSMSTKEGGHGRASYHLRTGYLPLPSVRYPQVGSLVAREIGREDAGLPNFVSIAPSAFTSSDGGFLGPQYAPLVVGEGPALGGPGRRGDLDGRLRLANLRPPAGVARKQADARLELLRGMNREFGEDYPGAVTASHRTACERAVRLMRSPAAKAFNLGEEKAAQRDAYGRTLFGQGCLLARRLIERGVPFVEVGLGLSSLGSPAGPTAWDTHTHNWATVRRLSGILDPAWAALMEDLKQRGLLDRTLIVWMGEFGRTPKINADGGRDHWPKAWTTVLAGGGIKGGQAVGKTSKDGSTVEERAVSVPDFMATVCKALGIDPDKKNRSPDGRPISIVDRPAKRLREVLA
jgi:hypothetical protein